VHTSAILPLNSVILLIQPFSKGRAVHLNPAGPTCGRQRSSTPPALQLGDRREGCWPSWGADANPPPAPKPSHHARPAIKARWLGNLMRGSKSPQVRGGGIWVSSPLSIRYRCHPHSNCPPCVGLCAVVSFCSALQVVRGFDRVLGVSVGGCFQLLEINLKSTVTKVPWRSQKCHDV